MNIFKTQQQIITEIHNEFDTAQDRLLDQANAILSSQKTSEITPVESIGERLQKVGFVNVPVAKKANVIKEVKKKAGQIAVATKEQANLIQYYKSAYPFLKFLTDDELNRICDKYSLIHAPVGNYIKEVPEKNLRDIETAQPLNPKDIYKTSYVLRSVDWWMSTDPRYKDFVKNNLINKENIFDKEPDEWDVQRYCKSIGFTISSSSMYYNSAKFEKLDKSGLFIAAPKTHFDLKGLSNKSKHGFFRVFEIEVKDPIVFRYVRGGIQVITKWGLEASDPALVLPINN